MQYMWVRELQRRILIHQAPPSGSQKSLWVYPRLQYWHKEMLNNEMHRQWKEHFRVSSPTFDQFLRRNLNNKQDVPDHDEQFLFKACGCRPVEIRNRQCIHFVNDFVNKGPIRTRLTKIVWLYQKWRQILSLPNFHLTKICPALRQDDSAFEVW